SLLGTEEALDPEFPIDYLVFSSGAGIYDWQKKQLVHHHCLNHNQVEYLHGYLQQISSKSISLDFIIQLETPHTHRFLFTPENHNNLDFISRLKHHQLHGAPLQNDNLPHAASEFIVIQAPETGSLTYEKIKSDLTPDFNVVRATSPIDAKSVWIEIFHAEASKGHAADWIREKHRIPKAQTFALGNDYNDLQLLSWAENPLVVGDAAPELLEKYQAVAQHSENALAHALEIWLKKLAR
ncbi:MAG: HAD hydrolase family protein, partial [Pseudomonadota bacterium]